MPRRYNQFYRKKRNTHKYYTRQDLPTYYRVKDWTKTARHVYKYGELAWPFIQAAARYYFN